MSRIFGYGEDALTLWALKNKLSVILNAFNDPSDPEDCVVFYRPSFGRSGGNLSAQFGEFDAIVASKQAIYLVESKWDNNSRFDKKEVVLRSEQVLRHQLLKWYINNWDLTYSAENWDKIREKQGSISYKVIPPKTSLLAKNLQFILTNLIGNLSSGDKVIVENVLLFFYNHACSKPPAQVNGDFKIVPIEYGEENKNNFISL